MKSRIHTAMAALFLLALSAPLRGQKAPQVQPPVIRVGEDGVFVRVLVTDPLNRYVAGLGKEHFRIYEDGTRQTVHSFVQQSAPVSIGLAFDLTASLGGQADTASLAVAKLAQSARTGDEYFMIFFDDKGARIREAGADAAAQRHIAFAELTAPRKSPLIEAIRLGMDRLRQGVNEKKALIIIGDREITSSHPAVQIYAISGLAPWNFFGSRAPAGAGISGVRTFVSSASEVDYYIRLIQDELRNQYILGYTPSNKNRDGKWRAIEIRLDPPKNLPRLTVVAGKGYAAPTK